MDAGYSRLLRGSNVKSASREKNKTLSALYSEEWLYHRGSKCMPLGIVW